MPTPRTIPQLEAMRITVLHTKMNEMTAKRDLKLLEIQQIDARLQHLREEIQQVFDRNGFKGVPVGGVLSEAENGLPAGTVLQLDQKPFVLPTETDAELPPIT